ncbi:DUF6069 family protein [Catellatospora tritici]|uniref:DUF6069 family protein n=1 Tax=Catellatospora tritici TaxID=2851566 RepID=UPI001C2D6F1D|nr:DUF6069 family protein [Catellatospora tritici]MBV1850554.1 hypothetical protein [Catellatospora tritici]
MEALPPCVHIAPKSSWCLLRELADIDLSVRSGDAVRDIGVSAVAVTAALTALAGWGPLALLERRVRRPRRTWIAISVAVFVVSLLAAASGATPAAQAHRPARTRSSRRSSSRVWTAPRHGTDRW